MTCIVCGNRMTFYFEKDFKGEYNLEDVKYFQCVECGFTQSATHFEMTNEQFLKLNELYHLNYLGSELNKDDLNWIKRLNEQSKVINDAAQIGLLKKNGKWLDYGCGDGKLSELINSQFNLILLKYDEYLLNEKGYLSKAELIHDKFDFVITTSVFEHLTKREEFDAIESLVSPKGVLGIHTLVCESIPEDPSWFYLLPVHCSFHSNKSMSYFFEQWGYEASVYNVESRLWLWFKKNNDYLEKLIENANKRSSKPKYIYKQGFVDYWK